MRIEVNGEMVDLKRPWPIFIDGKNEDFYWENIFMDPQNSWFYWENHRKTKGKWRFTLWL
jgi:hypothetical protein